MSDEEWRPVVGWEGLYEVSSLGRVKSNRKILNPTRFPTGHLTVTLYGNGGATPSLVHRLVAQAFIPNPDNLPFVLHWDDVPGDNRVDNLRWGTNSDNTNDSVRNGTHFHSSRTHCPKGHPYLGDNIVKTRNGKTCKECRREFSNRSYHRKKNNPTPFDKIRHGTPSGYGYHRCRCELCTEGHKLRARDYDRRKRENPGKY